jgi:protein TonB
MPRATTKPSGGKPSSKAAKRRRSRVLTLLAIAVVTTLLGGGAIAYIRGIVTSAPAPQKQVVQNIQIIRPPPPPPDLPPPPPPPPDEKIDVSQPQPQPDPIPSNEPPPSEQLGLDTEGGAGGDAFGLVGHPGGHGLLGSGGSAFAWYAGLLKGEIQSQLGDEAKLRSGAYSVIVRIWVRDDGTIDKVQLAQSSGDRERDRLIENALGRISRLSQAPPADMPQPISLRIVSRA